MQLYTNKWILFVQGFILFAGAIFLICAVIFNLPAINDEAIVGLKGIMLMILLVVNTSSHSLYTSEFYYINNKCSNKNCTTDLKKDIKDFNDEININNKKSSIKNVLTFNLFILNSSYFLIFSILINIIQTTGMIGKNKILVILSFYSFLIFLIIISINYLLYNYLLYKTFKKIIEK
ncbi:MAG: hypothetical protein M1407_02380 [Deltaproteobacteria bacterium]|nr:hypothetical protein [Deltaproteobacteria bacterium]